MFDCEFFFFSKTFHDMQDSIFNNFYAVQGIATMRKDVFATCGQVPMKMASGQCSCSSQQTCAGGATKLHFFPSGISLGFSQSLFLMLARC